MKRKLLVLALALAASAGTGFAQQTGTYGIGIELKGTGAGATNNGATTLYSLDGTSDALPPGSSAALSTAWGGASTGTTPTFSLGTFVAGVDTLTLTGGSIDSWKNEGYDVTGATLEYSLTGNSGPYTAVNLPFGANLTYNGDSSGHNQIWDTESASTNLLSGLSVGTYTLAVYGFANGSDGTRYENNNGNNFGATFTVAAAPEPGVWAMMLGGLGMLVSLQRFRRKSSV